MPRKTQDDTHVVDLGAEDAHEQFADLWEDDWGPLLEGISEEAGISEEMALQFLIWQKLSEIQQGIVHLVYMVSPGPGGTETRGN